jgi:hypothetical protein
MGSVLFAASATSGPAVCCQVTLACSTEPLAKLPLSATQVLLWVTWSRPALTDKLPEEDELEELDEDDEDDELLLELEPSPWPTPPQATSKASPLLNKHRLKKVTIRTGTPARRYCCVSREIST